MPEGPIPHSEPAALTRCFEEVAAQNSREFGIIKSDLTAVRLQFGTLDQKVENLSGHVNQRLDGLEREDRQLHRRAARGELDHGRAAVLARG
ncbi:hypothetical protein [Streptomyces sp. NPDC001389]|uniref:hypothetical protein n=1 Tax=Streptomyces sp. NPDC001389 TaxID=3364569 RepID=UPI0036CFDA12